MDDSTSVRKVLERLLSTRGLSVTTSETAEQGLEAIHRNAPHLVIADVVMPGMSGFELCQKLKSNQATQGVPVILISGIINDGVIAQARQAGAFDVVSKPFTPDDLFPKIERALKASYAAPSPPAEVPEAPQPPLPPQASEPLDRLQEELKPFLDKPEVESALIIGPGGQLRAWAGQPFEEPDLLATYLHTLLSIAGVLGERYQLTAVQTMTLEYPGKTLLLSRINPRFTLVLALRGTGGTGVVRYLVLKGMPQLRAALDQTTSA
ncbi:MAG: response regulator [Meiothermus sp.]|uniref:hybrid sensor histidine kinase/response regulator n=1 Tax=Meiothermus sp. TaxID=1955249 RepID=UPI0026370322|nr:hybrid sensor histidine kinase/response regulator [Meiothermus sp.]MCS7057908.1 response regulator [Meiothermus sp.]MCX7741471.1 response regulator [Meiothermus sp.]MDW8090077.1 response regulator [Meiothermus sp.]MDW8480725.1 response regulator [Meiothermus sp.]